MGKSSKSKAAAKNAAIENTPKNKANETMTKSDETKTKQPVSKEIVAEHLPPLPLVFTIIACSGVLFVFSFRDVFATGRNVGGEMDEAMLAFTKSISFFDNEKGWKSTQGGLSTIQDVTTDANNMGGLFVRKVGGAAGLAIQIQKLMPMLIHPLNARWKMGHFRPLLWTAAFANTMLASFYASYMQDFAAAGAATLPVIFVLVLAIEAMVILAFLFTSRDVKRGPAVALPQGKIHTSIVSRIVARTVGMVSGVIALIAGREVFFPGQIFDFIPRDDIFLEWTGALIHSPPEGTAEAMENGMASSLHIGDKFLSQLMGLNFLVLCMFKFYSAFVIRYGSDGSGVIQTRMFWKAQCIGNTLILMLFRLFAPAAQSASLDLRWHLMCIAYETFILGLCGYF